MKDEREKGKKVELLAPAGSAEGFYGAIHAGADAVYLGGSRFGARAYAQNFTTQELVSCIRYAHLLDRKVYLTVNTLLKEQELSELYEYLSPFCEAGLDAVIVQDLGVLKFVREYFPQCRIHASTQMTLCGSHGAKLIKEMGASRIVPARELSLKELAAIKKASGVELETFVHGAMCYCYSGQCLLSSMIGARSGNRGRCAQPCRLPYCVTGEGVQTGICYPLSLKDMCAIEHIPALIEAGIDSFKIEGRMKKPEYTAGVTAIYRKSIDRYYELRNKMEPHKAAEACKVKEKEKKSLYSLYIRSEVQDGYYFRRNGREMITLDSPAYSGSDEDLLRRIHERYLKEPVKLPVTVEALFQKGQPACISLKYQDAEAQAVGEVVQAAERQPISLENVKKQLSKMGESPFYAADLKAEVEADCFYPLRQINELRREAVAGLEEAILQKKGCRAPVLYRECAEEKADLEEKKGDSPTQKGYVFSVVTMPQLKMLAGWLHSAFFRKSVRIYIDGDLILHSRGEVQDCAERLLGEETFSGRYSFYAVLPYILREAENSYLDALYDAVKESGVFQGFLIRSIDGAGFLAGKKEGFLLRLDAGMYIWNHSAAKELASLADGFCLPYELNEKDQFRLLSQCKGNYHWEKIVYGRIPMMVTANCLLRTADRCPYSRQADRKAAEEERSRGERRRVVLTDKQHKKFPADMVCRHCMNIIYNSVPLSLHLRLDRWETKADLRMDFTIESPDEMTKILDCFLKNAPFPKLEYTTGHEKRGAE